MLASFKKDRTVQNRLSHLRKIKRFELSQVARKKTCSVNFECSFKSFKEPSLLSSGAGENEAADYLTDYAGIKVDIGITSLWINNSRFPMTR